jgi:PAS domain-containing protein
MRSKLAKLLPRKSRPKSAASLVRAARTSARNKKALLLFGRAAMTTVALMSAGTGFFLGILLQQPKYNPYTYAAGVAVLLAIACTAIAYMLVRRRMLLGKLRKLEARIDELSDRNWELGEAAERVRSLLAAQGDLIVRRDAEGTITYANDAFCALAGKKRDALLGTPFTPPVKEQGPVGMLPDGTRMHDQKIASAAGARWIAWREVPVRS